MFVKGKNLSLETFYRDLQKMGQKFAVNAILDPKNESELKELVKSSIFMNALLEWLKSNMNSSDSNLIVLTLQVLCILPLSLEHLKEFKFGKYIKKLTASRDSQTQKIAKELFQAWTDLLQSASSGSTTPTTAKATLISPNESSVGTPTIEHISLEMRNNSISLNNKKRSEMEIDTPENHPKIPKKIKRESISLSEATSHNNNNNNNNRSNINNSSLFSLENGEGRKPSVLVKDPENRKKRPKKKVSFAQGPKLTQIKIFEVDEAELMHKRRGSESNSSYRDFEKREASLAFMIAQTKWFDPPKLNITFFHDLNGDENGSSSSSLAVRNKSFISEESKFHAAREKTTLSAVFMDASRSPWSATEPDDKDNRYLQNTSKRIREIAFESHDDEEEESGEKNQDPSKMLMVNVSSLISALNPDIIKLLSNNKNN